MAPDKRSFIQFPTFLGQLYSLSPQYTGEGLCYTFNSLDSDEIYSDE